jgi:peptidoglycan hydrolase-like protein with peptidoglycan-binding domain
MAIPGSVVSGSVGLGGSNKPADVALVQRLLNAVPASKGGPLPLLDVDSQCGPITCSAIQRFQKSNGVSFPDGRLDPGQQTEKALLALLAAMGVLAGLLAGLAPGPVPILTRPSPGSASPAGNAASPIRRRFMAICQELLPPPGSLTQGAKPAGASGTGCGELPGRVFARVPVIPPGKPGAFKVTLPGGVTAYLTSPITQWEQFAKKVDADHGAHTWMPFPGGRPLPGDIYVLHKYENPSLFQHVGIIVSAEGSEWVTADGGQGNGWQSGFVRRHFQPSGQIDGEFGNKAMLRGWVNLDALRAVAGAAFPANL